MIEDHENQPGSISVEIDAIGARAAGFKDTDQLTDLTEKILYRIHLLRKDYTNPKTSNRVRANLGWELIEIALECRKDLADYRKPIPEQGNVNIALTEAQTLSSNEIKIAPKVVSAVLSATQQADLMYKKAKRKNPFYIFNLDHQKPKKLCLSLANQIRQLLISTSQ
ncbi:hypothetical protein HY086_06910 [Candidatus Gottesmanbacteria bacterium]|nr:hypothetical protein [Candidatus Gottesmanbacteria bacterium]